MEEYELIPKDKTIYWLHILTKHKTQDLKKLGEELSILNHQIQHFNSMSESTQNLVIDDLNNAMNLRQWNKRVQQ